MKHNIPQNGEGGVELVGMVSFSQWRKTEIHPNFLWKEHCVICQHLLLPPTPLLPIIVF